MSGVVCLIAAALQLPVPFCWQFDAPTLTNRTYLADLDYLKANTEAEPASFGGLRSDDFDVSLAERIGCPKSAIPGGCVYDDGSFCLVSEAAVTGQPTAFDVTVDGRRFRGTHTGVFA